MIEKVGEKMKPAQKPGLWLERSICLHNDLIEVQFSDLGHVYHLNRYIHGFKSIIAVLHDLVSFRINQHALNDIII